ncbi:MAG TPA: hypothetical protein VIT85_08185 [Solirubrobacterales bacterium]|jgi:hypothetical protein
MGCLVALFALISPRLALFVILVFSDWIDRAFDGWVLPVLGFFLLPWTTLAYTVMWVSGGRGVDGLEWAIVILGFVLDIGSYREGDSRRRSR